MTGSKPLVARLRARAEELDGADPNLAPDASCPDAELLDEAADAIERLTRELEESRAANWRLLGTLGAPVETSGVRAHVIGPALYVRHPDGSYSPYEPPEETSEQCPHGKPAQMWWWWCDDCQKGARHEA
jgi:hypothetical protein